MRLTGSLKSIGLKRRNRKEAVRREADRLLVPTGSTRKYFYDEVKTDATEPTKPGLAGSVGFVACDLSGFEKNDWLRADPSLKTGVQGYSL